MVDLTHRIEPASLKRRYCRQQTNQRGMIVAGIVGDKRRARGVQGLIDRFAAIRLR